MKTMSGRFLMCVIFVAAMCMAAAPAFCDDVTDTINEGLAQYKKGQYTEAASSLDYAAQLIRQKKGGSLETLLPKPLPGWTGDDPVSAAVGSAMLGGGITAERRYHKSEGEVTVRIMADSPAMQGLAMVLSNPAFASSSGMKLTRINGQRAAVEYDNGDKSGNISLVVANRFLVMVECENATIDDMKAYASAMDYDKLASLP